MREFLASLPPQVTPLERMLALEQQFFLADHNLIIYRQDVHGSGGGGARALSRSGSSRFRGTHPDPIQAARSCGQVGAQEGHGAFFPAMSYRPKTGFGAPVRRWMRHELRDLVGDLLSTDSLKRRGLFDPTAVQRLITENLQGRIEASYVLLSLLCIEIWCRRFGD